LTADPLDILQQYWGYDQFRPAQLETIQSVLEGTDTLTLLPTGGGKSICFQVPALCKPGICIVVSPLIALMKDQVESLQKRGIRAAAIYSGMHYSEIDRILDNCIHGDIKLLYLSPERLTTELAVERIKQMNVNLLTVDEAHCISQWGYDFRPPYLEIAAIREWMPGVPVLALTATATPPVVEDIQEKLAFKDQQVFQNSFVRSNLAYVVLQEEDKEGKLVEILKKIKGTAVVYARNRRKTKEVAWMLRQRGIQADFYHAGLSTEVRAARQEAWINDRCRVIVSTNAFGMGIDKPNVRVVVHLDLPDSMEAYFQEAGRAGRDGKKAYAVLLYNSMDPKRLEQQYQLAFPPMEEIRRVYRALGSYLQLAVGSGQHQIFDFDIIPFCQAFQLKATRTLSCLKILELEGWLTLTDAVFVPSMLKIIVSKDELYDYQLRNPKLDAILKTILRTYQGAFNNYIRIREGQLAKFLKQSVSRLQSALEKMHREGIIHYQPQKDKPQLILLQERVDADNLTIDQQLYNFRKNRHYERIQKAINYAEQAVCRSQQLLRYFGETDSPKCGICDVCLGRTKSEVSTDEYDRYKAKIQRLLQKEALTLEELVGSFAPKRENQVLRVLEHLLDEGFVDKKEDFLGQRTLASVIGSQNPKPKTQNFSMQKLRIIATVTNDLTYDQRMIRICTSLARAGHEVVLVGRQRANSKPLRAEAFQQKRLTCWFDKGKWFYLEYNIRLFFWLLSQRVDVICSVDLDTILPGFAVSRLRSAVCVYDAHEYFTEVPEVVRRPMIQKIWATIARSTIPRLRHCYTVGPALARLFEQEYGVPFGVVRNVPYQQTKHIPPANFEQRIILYQGALNEGRGLECAIEAMQYLEEGQLWLVGEGDLSLALREQVANLGLADRVRFWGFIPPHELGAITLQATVGLNLLENKGLSYYYSLANKAFDYIQAGLPSVQMAFPEYQALQEAYAPFVLLETLQSETLATLLRQLFSDREAYLALQANCLNARVELCWEREEEQLLGVYTAIAKEHKV
jgi:ATP-dependent DNA helicase RecQ